jgi:hypothetical protein
LWALELCQKCWSEGSVPDVWHAARVAALFKKGDVANCENYRPISLLPIGYKLFALILLHRLKAGGAENRIWRTQFGFRSERGTLDALFLARRLLDQAWAAKDGNLIILALDWAKAFDSVSPDALLNALDRFGVPQKLLQLIRAIYTARHFSVRDAGETSNTHPQHFGICQGCPLSPFLFSMLMTVLMHDAKASLLSKGQQLTTDLFANDLLYADDTLVIDVTSARVEQFMQTIGEAGLQRGLVFNWSKLELMSVRCAGTVAKPDGTHVKETRVMKYLGSLLCNDGRIGSELGSRIGAAQAEFN